MAQARTALRAEEKPIGTEVAAPAPKGKRGRLIGAAVAVVLLAGGAGAAWHFLQTPPPEDAAAVEAAPVRRGPPRFLPIDTFTVNIRGEESEHFLQVGLTLQTVDAKTGERIKEYLPMIRNSLLLLLSSKKVEELKTVAGKEQLQKDILAAARAPLPGNTADKGIDGVLFSQFVIQ